MRGVLSPVWLFRGVRPIRKQGVLNDVLAGITLAALGIPEVMGYTKIAETPVVTGLYTLLLPVVAFAALGASRHLVVSADSATAAILAATLVTVAVPRSANYVALTALVALVVAVMLLLAYFFHLAFLADFLSRSALIGLLTGIGVQVAAGELAGLLGIEKQGGATLKQLASVFVRLEDVQFPTFALSLLVIAVIVFGKRFAPKIPAALLAVVGAIIASVTFDLGHLGITVVGAVPSGCRQPTNLCTRQGDSPRCVEPTAKIQTVSHVDQNGMDGTRVAARQIQITDRRRCQLDHLRDRAVAQGNRKRHPHLR